MIYPTTSTHDEAQGERTGVHEQHEDDEDRAGDPKMESAGRRPSANTCDSEQNKTKETTRPKCERAEDTIEEGGGHHKATQKKKTQARSHTHKKHDTKEQNVSGATTAGSDQGPLGGDSRCAV